MDDGEAELLRLIYTRIGMIMEDASSLALVLGGPRSRFDLQTANELRRSVDAIVALMAAADSLGE